MSDTSEVPAKTIKKHVFQKQYINLSGRPKGSKTKGPQRAQSFISKVIEKEIPLKERIKKLAELARGVIVEKEDKNGKKVVYAEKPDLAAIKHLNEYDLGKPAENIDMPKGIDVRIHAVKD